MSPQLRDLSLKILVADDEEPARQRLIDLLGGETFACQIVEAADGITAARLLAEGGFDLAFLDIQMPGLTGLELVRTVDPARLPLTVFVTAYDSHAVAAFETNALDYLLKPVSEDRFRITLDRALSRLRDAEPGDFLHRVANWAGQPATEMPWDRIVIKANGVTRFVPAADIDLIESAGVYVTLHTGGKQVLYRCALNLLAERLDPHRFVRVHRSAIVNIESVVQLDAISHGEYEITLKHGARTRISRSYRANLEKRLGQAL